MGRKGGGGGVGGVERREFCRSVSRHKWVQRFNGLGGLKVNRSDDKTKVYFVSGAITKHFSRRYES